MPNKLSLSINVLGLTGAVKATLKGEECIVIRVAHSRIKMHANGKAYLNLDCVENKNGVGQYGDSHFVAEVVSKEQREAGEKGAIIGNAKAYDNGPRQQQPAKKSPPPQQPYQGEQKEYPADDDSDSQIPF